MEKAVNLCDVGYRFLRQGRIESIISLYKRIYIGSYFCDRYFVMSTQMIISEIKHFCIKNQKKVTLVIPIFSEANVEAVKKDVKTLLRKYGKLIDTVVINDLGMLCWMYEHYSIPLVLGRLFSKGLRDPRYPDTFSNDAISAECIALMNRFHCKGIEIEGCFHNAGEISSDTEFLLYAHTAPYYMSCTRQCFFAAIQKNISNKFRSNADCCLECSEYRMVNEIQEQAVIHRIGKGIYFEVNQPADQNLCADFMIEMPLEIW